RAEAGYEVGKPLRDACVFAKHDLLKDPPFSKMDFVSCRNVLIYFGPGLQKRALAVFHYALNPDGFLMLGSAEHIAAFSDLFTVADRKHKLYRKAAVASRLHFGVAGEAADAGAGPEVTHRRAEMPALEIQKEADRISLQRFVPAGVVVDETMEIVQFRGQTGSYLEPRSGSASLNLLKMAREGLLLQLRSALQRARKEGVPVRRSGVRMKGAGGITGVDIEVVPFTTRQTRGRLFLVLFDPSPRRGAGARKPPSARAVSARKDRPSRVEQELAATKEYLQSIVEEQEATNEELVSANEEILSSNEELQSTNEELETAKE